MFLEEGDYTLTDNWMLTNKELKPIIDKIITDAFRRLEYAYHYHRENNSKASHNKITRLVFPKFRNGNTWISEQELRFAFVEAFNASQAVKDANLFYSVETPTEKQYTGFTNGKPVAVTDDEQDGRSGEFDMVIFNDKQERVCLIEFKANNAGKSDHEKDLLKLKEEGEGRLCYFIEVLKSYTIGDKETTTIGSLKRKLKLNNKEGKTLIRCYALEGKKVVKRRKEKI